MFGFSKGVFGDENQIFCIRFFLYAHNFSRGIQKSYLEHRAGIIKIRKMKAKKVLTKIKDMMTHLRSGNDILKFQIKLLKKDPSELYCYLYNTQDVSRRFG